MFVFDIFATPFTLPALFVGLQLVTPRLGHLPSCIGEPNTEEHKYSIHLHGSHSPEDGPLLSVRIYSPPGFGALCLPETFLCPAPERIRGRKTATAAATLGYSTAWQENILRCLISTVGKAILTKPINPWASDGTDLIPPAADVPACLCTAVLWYPALWCALLHFAPPRNTNSHNDAACSFVRSMVLCANHTKMIHRHTYFKDTHTHTHTDGGSEDTTNEPLVLAHKPPYTPYTLPETGILNKK